MAGIYIHIPFCSQKCGYCDFYSITRLSNKDEFINALISEISIRSGELNNTEIKTLYFGGGTPSLLSISDFSKIFEKLHEIIDFEKLKEITVEANPDDMNFEYLSGLKKLGVNRLSVGIQSFENRILAFMNRRHDAKQAQNAIQIAQNVGFGNISVDLIYGIPKMDLDTWSKSVQTALQMNVQHISAYHLTFEPDTPFYKRLKRGEIVEIDDKDSLDQYFVLVNQLTANGYIDYEISNFCLRGYESMHNSNYWNGKSYFGLGPSAHSFHNSIRKWNVSNLNDYLSKISTHDIYYESETLSEKDRYNESIMLGLRTKKGVSVNNLISNFTSELSNYFTQVMEKNISIGNLTLSNNYLQVTNNKKFLTDKIISDFFVV